MSIKYAELTVTIRGIDTDDAAINFLVGWLQEATRAALLGNQRDTFKFRNEFEDDIKVEIYKLAGN